MGDADQTEFTRRALLSVLGVGAAGLALGSDFFAAQPSFASSAPMTASNVIKLALSYEGRTLKQVQATTTGPWLGLDAAWCAWFVSWCLRGLDNDPYESAVSGLARFGTQTTSPKAGDIAVWPGQHTGLVSKIANGKPWIIHGNAWSTRTNSSATAHRTTKVAHAAVWGSPLYYRPRYSSTSGDTSMLWLKQTDSPGCAKFFLITAFGFTTYEASHQSSAVQISAVLGTSKLVKMAEIQRLLTKLVQTNSKFTGPWHRAVPTFITSPSQSMLSPEDIQSMEDFVPSGDGDGA